MPQHPADRAVRRQLAEHTGTREQDWHLVFKARYGMAVVFRAVAQVHGPGEVATQIFTCSTAVDPILVGGLRPAYGEVSPDSVALDPDRLTTGERTRAVVLQHTFGIVDRARAQALRARADEAGALLVEDSAHTAGTLARDDDGRPLADVSVHSFGAEKMLPTRFGGAIWVNPDMADAAVRDRLTTDLAALPVAGRRLDATARAYRTQVRLLNRLPQPAAAPLRAALTRAGAFEPLISPIESAGGLPYPPMAPSPWMTRQIEAQLPTLPEVHWRRSAAVAEYVRQLADVVQVPAAIGVQAPLARFPFFARTAQDAQRLFDEINAAGFYAGRWYRPALFPGAPDPSVYGYRPGDPALATSEDLIARVVNLPTTVSVAQARRAAEVVRREVAPG